MPLTAASPVSPADAQAACDARIEESGALTVHPFDAPLAVAGQGTLGIEREQQVEHFDTVLVAAAGGGLAAGIAADSLGARQMGDVPWSVLRDRARLVAGARRGHRLCRGAQRGLASRCG